MITGGPLLSSYWVAPPASIDIYIHNYDSDNPEKPKNDDTMSVGRGMLWGCRCLVAQALELKRE